MTAILVTGSTGLLGANLIRWFSERGRRVRALARHSSNPLAFRGVDVERVVGDIRDVASLRRAAAGCEYVVHAAASTSMATGAYADSLNSNVAGALNVLLAARDAGVRRVVHVSSVETIGYATRDGWGATPDKPSHEEVPYDNDRFGVPYTQTKYRAEQAVLAYDSGATEIVVVNPCYMLGAWDIRPSSGQMILQIARGLVSFYPLGGNNFVDVLDVCAAIESALTKARPQERYILGHENLSYRDAWTMMARVTGVRPPSFALPRAVAVAGGWLAATSARMLGRESDVNGATARVGYLGHYFDSSKAIAQLGMPQTPVAAAVERAWRWFRDYNYA